MFAMGCPQCSNSLNGASNRLVRDSCGHEKCRMCLLNDEENCQQCNTEQKPIVIKCENSHSGVITCNGTPSKANICPIIQNGNTEQTNELTKKIPEGKTNGRVRRSKTKSEQPKAPQYSVKIPAHITQLKDPPEYKCNICTKQFATKSHIKYHLYCTGEAKPFQCTLCPKSFVTKSHLGVHTLKHSNTKPFSCNICQKGFTERSKLNRHTLLHSGSKPYVCCECGKSYRSKESLKIHMLIHRGEKPFACRICSATFNNSSNLNKHLISHSNEKAHMCDQCGKRFKLKWALTVHRRSHLKIRPFECTTCSRSFANNKDLQRHLLIHLESKAYTCSICSTTFRRKDNLYRHVKNAHPGKKAESISSTVKQLLVKPKLVDNPNAINVITVSPASKKADPQTNDPDHRPSTVINGPLKLAFKTSAFKNHYNIQRDGDYEFLPKVSKSYDLAESVNICQKILSPHSPPRNIIRKTNESTSTEICQKILSPYPSNPIHYETSFEHKKHAMIKNIKFKLPSNYTNIKVNDSFSDIIPLKPVGNLNLKMDAELSNNNTYTELKTIPKAATSVIVNSNLNQGSSMHWRRRTSQNLSCKVLEN